MSPGANVRAIHALEDLRAAWVRFGAEAEDALRVMEQETRRTQEFLVEAETRWKREVQRREEIARRAASALARCRASGSRDREGRYYPPDCRAEEHALLRAKRDLAEAQAKQRAVREWIRLVQQTAEEYQKQARRLAGLLNEELPKATGQLARKVAILRTYTHMAPPTMSDSISIATPVSAETLPRQTDASSVPASVVDVQPVPVSQIHMDDMKHINGPEDFHKASYEDMVEGFRKLQEVVQPAVEEGHDVDYFRDLDQRLGLDYEHGYQRIFEAFYGDSAIRLEKIGQVYRVINGVHRLWVAKQLHIQRVPARVIEADS